MESNKTAHNPSFSSAIVLLRRKIRRETKDQNVVLPHKQSRSKLLTKIEKLILTVVEDISFSKEPKLQVPRRSTWVDCNIVNRKLSLKDKSQLKYQEILYTKNTKRMTVIFNLLAKVHNLLQNRTSVTYRELYYQHTDLYESQNTVKTAILDICHLLNTSPWDLRVFSTSKGLIAGPLLIKLGDNETIINCLSKGGMSSFKT
uniref:Spo11/DNA topoisomerase VI subunit A N-terminal domain-containing protein n=1 Tax=Clastoptera arizonana TaxID=38151 RepID=A0A1B6E8Y9_9HEMI